MRLNKVEPFRLRIRSGTFPHPREGAAIVGKVKEVIGPANYLKTYFPEVEEVARNVMRPEFGIG